MKRQEENIISFNSIQFNHSWTGSTILGMRCINPNLKHLSHLFFIILFLFTVNSCSDESSESTDLERLSGVWELKSTVSSNSCGMENGITNTDRIILIQCDKEVSVILGEGLWGTGQISGDRIDLTGTEVQTDETGCRSIRNSTGSLFGNSSSMEGTLSTVISLVGDSCLDAEPCSLEMNISLDLVVNYESSCIDRDTFGDPAESEYILPYPIGKSYKISNSYCIPTGGHRQQQAYDFLIPIGDQIVASRAGTVRQIKEDSPDDGQGSDHNHVMIEHTDGTVGFYAHLKQNGVLVQVGDNIESGQLIALAGHSGTTDVVHLHFGVYNSWPPTEGYDQAINFRNSEGPLDCRGGLVNGATYTAK